MSRTETLSAALFLALVAPTDEGAKRASDLAEQLARGMTAAQVHEAKHTAQRMVDEAVER